MNEIIVFPDIVETVVVYLVDQFADVGETASVASRVPDPRPAKFVKVQRTGGIAQTIVTDGTQVTIDAWAKQEPAAHQLAQLTRALLHAMRGTVQDGVAIYGVQEFAGPAFLPDPLSEDPRYSFTVQIGARGHAFVPSGS